MLKVRLKLRKVIALAICLAGSVTMFAQDVITLKNGDEILVVVQEVGIDKVKYKKFENSNGPNYTLRKSGIFMIKYENGSKDVFNETTTSAPSDKQLSIESELSYNNGVWQNGTKIKPDQVMRIMSGKSEALQQYNSGRSLNIAGQIIAYPCSFLLGWDLGTRIGGGEGNDVLLGVGASGIVIGLIMSLYGESKMKTAVQLYNSKISNTVSYQINFGFTQTGVGLCMNF